MPNRFFQYCKEPGCTTRTMNAYCDVHHRNNTAWRARQQRQAESRKNDPIHDLYNCPQWTKRFRPAFLAAGNVVCQKLTNGERCTHPVEILHHLISPRSRRDLMYSFKNVIGVCKQHHPPDEGTPDWREGIDFVATIVRELRF